MCRYCWWRLPAELREVIVATDGRDPQGHIQAVMDALEWYRREPLERTVVAVGPHPEPVSDGQREAEQRVLDVTQDLFAVLDAHGYRRTSDDAALGRAVGTVWALVDAYEGQAL